MLRIVSPGPLFALEMVTSAENPIFRCSRVVRGGVVFRPVLHLFEF